jgi:hypothetical protein
MRLFVLGSEARAVGQVCLLQASHLCGMTLGLSELRANHTGQPLNGGAQVLGVMAGFGHEERAASSEDC